MFWPRLGDPQAHRQFEKRTEIECANGFIMFKICYSVRNKLEYYVSIGGSATVADSFFIVSNYFH